MGKRKGTRKSRLDAGKSAVAEKAASKIEYLRAHPDERCIPEHYATLCGNCGEQVRACTRIFPRDEMGVLWGEEWPVDSREIDVKHIKCSCWTAIMDPQ